MAKRTRKLKEPVKGVKGVILAGGLGSRLHPLTKITNKHLLPIFDKPMIYYPLETLVEAGVEEIMIVTGGRNAGGFLELLGNGSEFGLKDIHYTYQVGEGGIAAALSLAENFIGKDKVVVILGDNIIEGSIRKGVEDFVKQDAGAKIFLKKVHDPQRFGVAEFKDKKVVNIVEKPKRPKSELAVTGIYMYDASVFDFIHGLKPSDRGELEITDVNNHFIKQGNLAHETLKGWWTDAGTFESLAKATRLVENMRKRKK